MKGLSSEYKRGWETCIKIVYYKMLKEGINNKKVFQVIKEIKEAINEDRIHILLEELRR